MWDGTVPDGDRPAVLRALFDCPVHAIVEVTDDEFAGDAMGLHHAPDDELHIVRSPSRFDPGAQLVDEVRPEVGVVLLRLHRDAGAVDAEDDRGTERRRVAVVGIGVDMKPIKGFRPATSRKAGRPKVEVRSGRQSYRAET